MPKIKRSSASAQQFLADRCDQLANQARSPKQPGVLQPTESEETSVHYLRNGWGWVIAYAAKGDYVTIRRKYKGVEVGEFAVPRCEARQHYRSLREGGFSPFNGPF